MGLYIATTGAVAPCCEYDGEIGHLPGDDLAALWTSDRWESLRADFRNARKHPACWKCFEREDHTRESIRTQLNRAITGNDPSVMAALITKTPEQPTYLDLRPSNICNLACRSCGHAYSSRWYKDAKAMGATTAPRAEIRSFPTPEDALTQTGPLVDKATHLYFAGGEPLLMPEHRHLLKRLIAAGRTDVAMSYNTNLTSLSLAGESIVELWKNFTNLSIEISIDAVGDRGALVRHGFDWEQFQANLRTLVSACPQARIRFGVTVSVMNILVLPTLIETLVERGFAGPHSFHLHPLQQPDHYRCQILPKALKVKAERDLRACVTRLSKDRGEPYDDLTSMCEAVIEFMWAADQTHLLRRFRRRMAALDQLRRENSLETLPELASILRPGLIDRYQIWRQKMRTNSLGQ